MKLENVKVLKEYPIQEGVSATTGKAWKSQIYLVQTQEQYPRNIAVELFGTKVDTIQLSQDQIVTLNVDVESRENQNKPGAFFTSVRVWGVEAQGATYAAQPVEAAIPTPAPAQAPAPAPQPTYQQPSNGDDGFPF